MSDIFSLHRGNSPLLISVPHDGWHIPTDIVQYMSDAGRAIPDTDWHVAELYEFAKEMGASMIVAKMSRYVVDLNRPADDAAMYEDQLATGLCPLQTFAGADIYLDPIEIDQQARVEQYWRPYHEQLANVLAELRDEHGHALLWDAHSINSEVPSLFAGQLPIFNVGTWGGRSCAPQLADAVMAVATQTEHDAVINARFSGGHITRYYGDPEHHIHALQLELAQRAYMHERTLEFDHVKAAGLRATLKNMLNAYQDAAG
ncbi:MAG: N-formylglutamate deformylase [Woeseiaceae bacterium]